MPDPDVASPTERARECRALIASISWPRGGHRWAEECDKIIAAALGDLTRERDEAIAEARGLVTVCGELRDRLGAAQPSAKHDETARTIAAGPWIDGDHREPDDPPFLADLIFDALATAEREARAAGAREMRERAAMLAEPEDARPKHNEYLEGWHDGVASVCREILLLPLEDGE